MEIVKSPNLETLNQNIKDDFYIVPNLKFDIDKLRADLNTVLKKKKFSTLGIKNFGAISLNQIPGDQSSTEGHNVRGTYWTIPDEKGKEIAEKTFWVTTENFELTFDLVEKEPFVVSYNRNYSAFAKVQAFYTVEQLEFLVLNDSDVCSRYMAFYQLSENLKMQLLQII